MMKLPVFSHLLWETYFSLLTFAELFFENVKRGRENSKSNLEICFSDFVRHSSYGCWLLYLPLFHLQLSISLPRSIHAECVLTDWMLTNMFSQGSSNRWMISKDISIQSHKKKRCWLYTLNLFEWKMFDHFVSIRKYI